MADKKQKTTTFEPIDDVKLTLLALVGKALFGKEDERTQTPLDTPTAAKLCGEARIQAVAALAFDGFSEPSALLEKAAYKGWLNVTRSEILTNEEVKNAHRVLTKRLNEAGIPYAILKGCASASCYPKPYLRVMGDVDFLVRKDDMDKTAEILKELGFTAVEGSHLCHVGYEKEGCPRYEMHYNPPGIPYGTPAEQPVMEIADGILTGAKQIDFDGFPVSVPDDLCQFFVLLLHLLHHLMSTGIGLRHLCDLAACYAVRVEKDFWENTLAPALKCTGLYTVSCTLLKSAVMYLGMPDKGVVFDVPEDSCEFVIRDILTGGNFGRRDKMRSEAQYFISSGSRAKTGKNVVDQTFKTLIDISHMRYPITKRVPVFHVFTVPVICVRYLFRVLTGKRVMIGKKSVEHAKKRKNLYDRLEMFEIK